MCLFLDFNYNVEVTKTKIKYLPTQGNIDLLVVVVVISKLISVV